MARARTNRLTRSYWKLTFFGLVKSELIKLFTLRSTWWISMATIVVNIGITLVYAAGLKLSVDEVKGQDPPPEAGSFGMLSNVVAGSCSLVGMLVFVILSVLILTNEYSSGMILSTFTVAPRRGRVVLAKLVVLTVACVVVFAVSMAVAWVCGYAILDGSAAVDLSLTSRTSIRILGGFIAVMVLISWFSFGLGAWIRSSAGSIGAAVGIVLVLPTIGQMIMLIFAEEGKMTGWRKVLVDAVAFLPTNAGGLVTDVKPDSSVLGPWSGLLVLGVWAVVSLAIGFVSIKRRDA